MATANIRAIITAQDRSASVLKGFSRNVDSMGSAIAGAVKVAGAALAAATSALTVFGLKTAGQLEAARMGFVTLLGSAKEADATMARIKKEAARTPFEITGLTQATQLLTAVTKNGDRALDMVLNVGEGLASMGRGQAELDRISINLQQIAASGRAFGIDIKQFAFAGIPIYEMLKEEIGLTGEALQKFTEEGGVTFELLEKMFKKASSAGGRWANAFENQAGTFNQLVSNMRDSFAIFASDFVKRTGIFDFAKRAILGLTNIMKGNNDTINGWVKSIRALAEQIGAYLGPKLKALWETLSKELIPALTRLWKEVIVPLLPVIGTALVVALGLAVDAINGLMNVLTPLIDLLAKNKFWVQSLIIVIGTLWATMKARAAFNVFMAGLNAIKTSAIPGVIGSLGKLKAALVGFTGFGLFLGVALAAFAKIMREINVLKNALDGAEQSFRDLDASEKRFFSSVDKAVKEGRISKDEGRRRKTAILQERAVGGAVSAGTPYMVGERRPEMFVPREGGRIVPQPKMGGSNQTINLNVNVGVYAGTEMEKRKLAESLMKAWQDLQQSRGIA